MRPDETFVGAPVRNLQTMLRYIAKQDSSYENVIPDGIYGAQTASAVSTFQRRNNLPITGVADLNTWEAIQQAYATARVQIDNAYPLQIILNPNQVIRRGEADPYRTGDLICTFSGIWQHFGTFQIRYGGRCHRCIHWFLSGTEWTACYRRTG